MDELVPEWCPSAEPGPRGNQISRAMVERECSSHRRFDCQTVPLSQKMPERNPTGNHIMISNNNWWCKPKGKVWLGSTGPGNGMRKWVRTKMMPRVNQVPTQKHTSPEKRNPKFLVMVPPVLIFQGFQDLSPLILVELGGADGWHIGFLPFQPWNRFGALRNLIPS